MPPKKGNKAQSQQKNKKKKTPAPAKTFKQSMPLVPSVAVLRPSNRFESDNCRGSDDILGLPSSRTISNPLVYKIYANNPSLFPRGAAEARRWDQAELISVSVEYQPYSSEFKSGVVVMAFDPDPQRDYTSGISMATLHNMYRVMPRISQNGRITVTQKDIHGFLSKLRKNPQQTPTGSDLMTTCFGQFLVLTEGTEFESSTEVGRLVAHYHFRYFGPQSAEILNLPTDLDADGSVTITHSLPSLVNPTGFNNQWVGGKATSTPASGLTMRDSTAAGTTATSVAAAVVNRLHPFGLRLGNIPNNILPTTNITSALSSLAGKLLNWVELSSSLEESTEMFNGGVSGGPNSACMDLTLSSGSSLNNAFVVRRVVHVKNITDGDLYFEGAIDDPVLSNVTLDPVVPNLTYGAVSAAKNAELNNTTGGQYSYTYHTDGGVDSSLSTGLRHSEWCSSTPASSGARWNAILAPSSPWTPVSSANGYGKPLAASGAFVNVAMNDQAFATVIPPGSTVVIRPRIAWSASSANCSILRDVSGTPTLFNLRLPGLPLVNENIVSPAEAAFPFWASVSKDLSKIRAWKVAARKYALLAAGEEVKVDPPPIAMPEVDPWEMVKGFDASVTDDDLKEAVSEVASGIIDLAKDSDRHALFDLLARFRKEQPDFSKSAFYRTLSSALTGL